MENINVALGGRSYNVHIEHGALRAIADHLSPYVSRGKILFVADESVHGLYWQQISENFQKAGVTAHAYVLPSGETSKSWDNLAAICEWLLEHETERSDHIVAFGGGVVGDITGFASALIKRGCNFVQIPTTLLAQVDSSVGGKTAINSKLGKNLVGVFHQPAHVLIDPEVLQTLPARQLRAGYAEVVKYGVINDAEFFAWCEQNGEAVLAGDAEAQLYAIGHSISAKAKIVSEDELELSGTRALLNLGHTFGHALEAATGFSDRLLHGEAVAMGIVLAAKYSHRLGRCPSEDAERIATHFEKVALPCALHQVDIDDSGTGLVAHMQHDKKGKQGQVPLLLIRGIGETFLCKDVDYADVTAFLNTEIG